MSKKRKLIDLDLDSVIKLSAQAIREGSNLKAYCEKVLGEVARNSYYNPMIIKKLKILVIDSDRCSCVSPDSCELCQEDSAYNVFTKKIINLVQELETGNYDTN